MVRSGVKWWLNPPVTLSVATAPTRIRQSASSTATRAAFWLNSPVYTPAKPGAVSSTTPLPLENTVARTGAAASSSRSGSRSPYRSAS